MSTTANGVITGEPTTTTSMLDWNTIINKPPKYILHITPQYGIGFHDEQPSAWVRFWQKALLGWTWEKLE